MKNKKILIQVNSISQFKKIIDFLQDDINIVFDTEFEKKNFEKINEFIDIKNINKNNISLVLGTEFCEHLWPTLGLFKSIFSEISKNQLFNKIYIQTWILTKYNQLQYSILFDYIKELDFDFSIILNDIWFIEFIKSKNIKFKEKVLWRLISKSRKVFNNKNITNLKFDDQSFNILEYSDFFKENWIKYFWVDILPQWINLENFDDKILYLPWWYYTSSRWCVTKSSVSDKNYIFPLKNCDKPCIDTYVEFNDWINFIWKWNSIFYESIEYLEKNNYKSFNIYLLQPFLPM